MAMINPLVSAPLPAKTAPMAGGTQRDPGMRREAILGLAREKHELTVDEIAGRFACSRETVRRDLAWLDARGLLRRIHGGAQQPKAAREPAFRERLGAHAEEKRRIARAAAVLFEPGDTLMIDSGSTTEAFAEALAALAPPTVITNSLRIAARLGAAAVPGRVIVIGGELRAETGQMLGALALAQIAEFRADHAVIGVGAIDETGRLMDYDAEEALFARAAMARSAAVTVLADHSKFTRAALLRIADATRISRLVTDAPPPPPLARALAAAAVAVIVAP